jgi:two-component system LytT family response regulator
MIRETLTNLEAKLNPKDFVRIRHSAIVNVQGIEAMHPLFKGEFEIILRSGAKLTSSRRYRARISSLIGE